MNLDNMPAVLRAGGVDFREVDGWVTRGYAQQDLQAVRAIMWHHTATGRGSFVNSATPTLNMCINGRSDLPGPLCQLYMDRNGITWIIATGVANHAGEGVYDNIPVNLGNHYTIGIEVESSGVFPWDWTPAQLSAMPKLGAALERGYLGYLPESKRYQIGHKEYSSTGKIDPAGLPGDMDGLRNSINALLGSPAPSPKPAPAPKPAPVATPVGNLKNTDKQWIFERGETFTQAAKFFNTSVATLAKFNGVKDPNKVSIGMNVWAPIPGAGLWVVDPGDTLTKIAAYYGVSVAAVKAANGLTSDKIKVGQRIIVL